MFKNLLYFILSIQEKFLRHQLAKTIGIKNNSTKKRHYTKGCLLDLSSMADSEKRKLEEELTLILKKYNYDPENILEYIKKQGTAVYYINQATKVLNPIRENEGFIYPAKGGKAIYLSLAINGKPKFKTKEAFILSKGPINKYYFIYHFYNWYAYKNNIAGLDVESQELLKKYLFGENDFSKLQLADIYKLKDAIRQDKASIEFVIKLCRNYDGAKQALEKLQNKDGAKL